MQVLIDMFAAFSEWLLEMLLWIPRKLFELLSDEGILLVEAIPCANACLQVVSSANTLLSGSGINAVPGAPGALGVVLQWLSTALYVSGVVVGLELIMCALLARFVLRRIPLIG